MTPDVPTGAMHAVSDNAASINENSLYAFGPRIAAHYTEAGPGERWLASGWRLATVCFGRTGALAGSTGQALWPRRHLRCIMYAQSCFFRGHYVPHLAMQPRTGTRPC